ERFTSFRCRPELTRRVHHPRAEGEGDGWLSGTAKVEHIAFQPGVASTVKERKSGQPHLRRPIGLRRRVPLREHPDRELGRKPPSRDAANGLQANPTSKAVHVASDE